MSTVGEMPVPVRTGIDELLAMADVDVWGKRALVHNVEVHRWQGRQLTVYRYSGGGMSFSRANEYLTDKYSVNVSLGFVHEGVVTTIIEDQSATHHPGDVSVVRMDRPSEVRASPGTEMTIASLPVSLLESRGIDTRQVHGAHWSADILAESALSMINLLATSAADDEVPVLESAVIELIVGMLAAHDSDGSDDNVAAQTRMRVMQMIDAQYTNVELDADRIAAALGASRRYLYALFEGRDASIATLIRDRRAAHAEKLLRSEPTYSIRQIAQMSGFGSEDRLLRTFKQLTGESPSAYRRRVVMGR